MKKITLISAVLLLAAIIITVLTILDLFHHRQYTNADFHIPTYISQTDKDGDGLDDQTDILTNVRSYIATKPKYESKYYSTGYPDDGCGVCTDVVAFGLKDAGYDIKDLLYKHITENRELYDIDIIDSNIDFRKVRNLKVYFDSTAISLTTDINQIEEWQGGDIVVFREHIGIVSDKRNKKGVTFVLHNGSPLQTGYEQDILEGRDDIIGHYRIS